MPGMRDQYIRILALRATERWRLSGRLETELAIKGNLERAKGIEPSYAAWEAAVLPLNYAREMRGNQRPS